MESYQEEPRQIIGAYCKLPNGHIACHKCGIVKPLDQFHTGRKRCKMCRQEYNKERYLTRKKEAKQNLK